MSMNFASMFEFTSDEQGLMAGPNSRLTEHGDLVDCYRNLNKPSMFSVRQREGLHKGLGAVDLCTYFAQQYIGSHIITNANATLLA